MLGPLALWQLEPFTPGRGAEKTSPLPGKNIFEVSDYPVLGMSSPADRAALPLEMAQPPPRPPPPG